MALINRLAAGITLAALASIAHAQLIRLPSVPVGGELQARVSVSGVGGGVPIALSVLGTCGTFRGAATANVVTDSTGSFSFVFTPGTLVGDCTMQGRSGNFVSQAITTIYRPSDVSITMLTGGWLQQAAAESKTQQVQLLVKSFGNPLYGIPVTFDAPATLAGGTPPSIQPLIRDTDVSGNLTARIDLPTAPGVWDFVVHAGSVTQQVLRVQKLASTAVTPARSLVARDDLAEVHGATTVSIANGPATCALKSATRATREVTLPSGVMEFPSGLLGFTVTGCPAGSTVTMKIDYPAALPANGVAYRSQGAGAFAVLTPSPTVSGSTLAFTLADESTSDATRGSDITMVDLAVGKPGTRVDAPKPAIHDMWWAGPAENGWGMAMLQSTDGNVFAAVYAYDDAGEPTWWVIPGVSWDYGRTAFEAPVYSTLGTPWSAFNTSLMVVGNAGSARLTPSGPSSASFDYVINGISGHKALERQVFGPADSRSVPSVNGMWWGGAAQSGWGISVVQQNATLFSVWFTYDAASKPTWYVMPGGQWTGVNTYSGRIYKTHGSPWLGHAYDASRLTVTDVGSYDVQFFSSSSGFMKYTLEGRSGTLQLSRQSPF